MTGPTLSIVRTDGELPRRQPGAALATARELARLETQRDAAREWACTVEDENARTWETVRGWAAEQNALTSAATRAATHNPDGEAYHRGQAEARRDLIARLERIIPQMSESNSPQQRNIPEAGKLLTPAEVATMFRVDPKTVTRWAKAGKLTAIRTLGGHRRYQATEVQNLLRPDSQ